MEEHPDIIKNSSDIPGEEGYDSGIDPLRVPGQYRGPPYKIECERSCAEDKDEYPQMLIVPVDERTLPLTTSAAVIIPR